MARTAHTARKDTGGKGEKAPRKTRGVVSEKTLSVRTPTISQAEKPRSKGEKASTNILREIKYYQSNVGFLVPKASVVRLIRSIGQDLMMEKAAEGLRFTSVALNILHEALENHIVCLLELAYLATKHAKRVTLYPSDIRLIHRIKTFSE